MSEYVYVTKSGLNKNGIPYKNYIYKINNDNTITYYDTNNFKININEYDEYGINSNQNGSGIKQLGGVDKVESKKVKPKTKKKENEPVSVAVVLDNPAIPVINDVIDNNNINISNINDPIDINNSLPDIDDLNVAVNVIDEDKRNYTRLDLIRNILDPLIIQFWENLNLADPMHDQAYILNNFAYIISRSAIKSHKRDGNNKKMVDANGQEIFNIYIFDPNDSDEIYNLIKAYFFNSGDFLKKCQYEINKTTWCINKYCYRAAHFDRVGKQRQECDQCKNYFTYKKSKTNPKGYSISDFELETGEVVLKLYEENTELAYSLMCYNNYNVSYWKKRVKTNTGYKLEMPDRLDGITFKQVTNKEWDYTPEQYFKEYNKIDKRYIFDYNVFKQPFKDIVHLSYNYLNAYNTPYINKLQYRCELKNRYNSYPSDIYELDHRDGDHHNNVASNIMCLCKLCHSVKTKLQRDKATESEGTRTVKDIYELLSNKNSFQEKINKKIADRKIFIQDSLSYSFNKEEYKEAKDDPDFSFFMNVYDNMSLLSYNDATLLPEINLKNVFDYIRYNSYFNNLDAAQKITMTAIYDDMLSKIATITTPADLQLYVDKYMVLIKPLYIPDQYNIDFRLLLKEHEKNKKNGALQLIPPMPRIKQPKPPKPDTLPDFVAGTLKADRLLILNDKQYNKDVLVKYAESKQISIKRADTKSIIIQKIINSEYP